MKTILNVTELIKNIKKYSIDDIINYITYNREDIRSYEYQILENLLDFSYEDKKRFYKKIIINGNIYHFYDMFFESSDTVLWMNNLYLEYLYSIGELKNNMLFKNNICNFSMYMVFLFMHEPELVDYYFKNDLDEYDKKEVLTIVVHFWKNIFINDYYKNFINNYYNYIKDINFSDNQISTILKSLKIIKRNDFDMFWKLYRNKFINSYYLRDYDFIRYLKYVESEDICIFIEIILNTKYIQRERVTLIIEFYKIITDNKILFFNKLIEKNIINVDELFYNYYTRYLTYKDDEQLNNIILLFLKHNLNINHINKMIVVTNSQKKNTDIIERIKSIKRSLLINNILK